MNAASTGDTTLRLERLIPSPPEVLFALWTEPSQLLKWWAPEGLEPAVHLLDVRPGGRWRIAMRRADGGVIVTTGIYRIIEPPHRLTFTWAWEDQSGTRGHETEVRVSFEARLGGTLLVLCQERFESHERRDGHSAGWSSCFDRMVQLANAQARKQS
jgi:uncharacterized protein YndB with AHSA1/START domain